MKKWKVYANVPTMYVVEVKAENEEQAIKIALCLDADDWEETGSSGDFIFVGEGEKYEPTAQES